MFYGGGHRLESGQSGLGGYNVPTCRPCSLPRFPDPPEPVHFGGHLGFGVWSVEECGDDLCVPGGCHAELFDDGVLSPADVGVGGGGDGEGHPLTHVHWLPVFWQPQG